MRPVRTALELRVILYSDIEWTVGELDCFYQSAVRRKSSDVKPRFCKYLMVIVVELIAVTVSLMYLRSLIAALHGGARCYLARIAAKS